MINDDEDERSPALYVIKMTDAVWEPLAELEINIKDDENSQIYCLCSRAFIRSKTKAESWAAFIKEQSENLEADNKSDDCVNQPPTCGKLEAEALSCYCSACSASHYSTDDHESVIISASDHQCCSKDQQLPYAVQNSDSGADLSEYVIEKASRISENVQVTFNTKSELETAWEKYWSENGENIIWKSWIEKYRAYINPSYLEQNLLIENFEVECNEAIAEENISSTEINLGSLSCSVLNGDHSNENTDISKEVVLIKASLDKAPSLKVSKCSSCASLSEIGDNVLSNLHVDESDTEEKILKSNSFGSYASYEKVKCDNIDYDRFKNNDNERVRSRCSNTNLSVKSIANTTVTTDSMTNVTKITLSSLDLSCECESVKSSSLLSTSGDDSSRPSSASSTSSKEEICTEADMWWKKLWKEHYEDQYASSYQVFKDNFDRNNDIKILKPKTTVNFLKEKFIKNENEFDEKKNGLNFESAEISMAYIKKKMDEASLKPSLTLRNESDKMSQNKNSAVDVTAEPPNASEIKSNLKRHLENSDDSFDDSEEVDNTWRKKNFYKKGCETGRKDRSFRKLDNVKQAMGLMGFSFKPDSDQFHSGYVKYRKKNIRGQNRRLKLCDSVPRTHLFFDDDGNPFDVKQKETSNSLPDSVVINDNGIVIKSNFVELESLGYEAHSSSIEDGDEIVDESKKQKKKKKKQKKYLLPREILENKNLLKYWLRRYQLFSKFDKGIKLDMESWFSVTPEKLARHHAERCRCDVIIDAFCGAGGNSIQFAFTCERVIAIDIDPLKIEMAKHNAKIYGVEDRIEFVIGDFIKLAGNLQADVVFLSPPWGGPDYASHDVFDLDNILPPLGGKELFAIASNIVDNVAYFLPKNANSIELALLCGSGGEIEIEQNIMDRRLRSVTAYFGGLIRYPDDPYVEQNW